jgi:hypothetical protein
VTRQRRLGVRQAVVRAGPPPVAFIYHHTPVECDRSPQTYVSGHSHNAVPALHTGCRVHI